ncbi:hypothetical protein BJY16_000465 [Actinoplanes octamycinicus]|uniref:Pyrrolo-quinoline quinone repeat domain-containing protein n=1 Tax=Actinoplanes octamycinicus TaxID=135948 RepID=A0A7W7GRS5_9ACTN|nr:PQQ-binding-like beta-propeller repeat protein [Actinoplanes octamycinicus]MBB4737006.1 hypothetical protein [Actinoplanes octamycinicus]GIE62143.1 hypothetical protein Aoc01nite_75450 [Actinoplanes octamycinicus]
MPTDLDELFTALGRQADAIPIAPAELARRRGRRRSRNQAAIAAAVAVCLVAGGIAGLLHRPGRHATPAVSPSARALTPVGAPIWLGGTLAADTSAVAGGRAFTEWQTADGTIHLLAADLTTGAGVWTAQRPGKPGELSSLWAVSQTVMLSSESTVSVYDAADGRVRWELPVAGNDRVLPHERGLIRLSGTGQTALYDWRSGKRQWSLDGLGDGPVAAIVTRTEGQRMMDVRTDDRLVQVSRAGQVRVVSVGTGTVTRSLTVPPPAERGMTIAYQGWLITQEAAGRAYRVRATDLGSGASAVVFTAPAGNELHSVDMFRERLFLLDGSPTGTRVVTVDPRQGRQLGEFPTADRVNGLAASDRRVLAGGQGITELYDENGRSLYRAPDADIHWLTPETLLRVTASGTVERIRVADGRVEPLGEIPLQLGECAFTTDRLACPVADGLRIWSLTG